MTSRSQLGRVPRNVCLCHLEERFTPADLLDALEKGEAWAKTFSKYKAGEDGRKPKAAAIGRVLARFRMKSRTPTKSGISYSKDEAIEKLSVHLPPESLSSFTHSSSNTSAEEVNKKKGNDGGGGSRGSDERQSDPAAEDRESPKAYDRLLRLKEEQYGTIHRTRPSRELVHQWLDEACVRAAGYTSNASILYREFSSWAGAELDAAAKAEFLAELALLGFRQNEGGMVEGLCLATDFDAREESRES